MASSFKQNSSYFQSVNNLHNCLLSLSSAGAEVKKVQIKTSGPVIQVDQANELEHHLEVNNVEKNGINYKQLELYRCTVVWEVA